MIWIQNLSSLCWIYCTGYYSFNKFRLWLLKRYMVLWNSRL